MIIELIVYIVVQVANFFGTIFPGSGTSPLLLPFGIDSALVSMISTWNAFMVTFPYAQTGWNMFLYFILPFELIMLIMKFVLGSRSPSNIN